MIVDFIAENDSVCTPTVKVSLGLRPKNLQNSNLILGVWHQEQNPPHPNNV